MNTKTKTTAKATASAVAVAAAIAWTYGSGDKAKEYKVALGDIGLNPETTTPAAFYLLSNGFKQSMADSIAGYAKELREEMSETGAKDGKGQPIMARRWTDEEVHAKVIEALDERFAAIKAGEVGLGSNGPRLRGVDKVMRDIATEELRALYIAKPDLTAPKGDDWAALVSRYTAKNDARLRDAANKRLHETAATADDISALLAEVNAAKAA